MKIEKFKVLLYLKKSGLDKICHTLYISCVLHVKRFT